MKLDIEKIKKIIDFMNDFSVDKVSFKIEDNDFLGVNIEKPFDYKDDYIEISIEDFSRMYYNGRTDILTFEEFKTIDEIINSRIYNTIKNYNLKNIIKLKL